MNDRRRILTITMLTLVIAVIPFFDGNAQRTKSSLSAGQQRHAEKGLKDNRYFFYFINSSVSNLGSEEQKALYREAIQRDLIARILYMKFSFHDSFVEIRKAQKLLIDLYRTTLQKDIAAARELLNGFAPEVINTNDSKARHYINLGYRDLAVTRQLLLMADNYRETLYSMRLDKYVRAIKRIKIAKRYAFLCIVESRKIREKPEQVQERINTAYGEMHKTNDEARMEELRRQLMKDKEQLELARADLGYLSFDRLHELIMTISGDKKDYYSLVHNDNYYRTREGTSFFDMVWDDPRLEEIKEYKEYQTNY